MLFRSLDVTGDINQTDYTSVFRNGAYLEISTGASNTAQITFNADYDYGTNPTYTPHYAGAAGAGMSIIKMPSGGVGGLEFYVKKHGTTSGSHDISTFTKSFILHQDGDIRLNGNTVIGSSSAGSSRLHLKYTGGSYGADSTSGFINEATTGRGTMRIRSATDNPAELFFDVNGGIRWEIGRAHV